MPLSSTEKTHSCVPSSARDRDARRLFGTVFQSIADEVLEYLRQVQRVGRHHGERAERDLGVGLRDGALQVGDCVADHFVHGHGFQRGIAHLTGARIFQQRFHQSVHALRARDGYIEELSSLLIQHLSRITAADELQIVG